MFPATRTEEVAKLGISILAAMHVYCGIDAPVGTLLLLELSGECGGQWFLSKKSASWNFVIIADR
jgi:hypothetical protein